FGPEVRQVGDDAVDGRDQRHQEIALPELDPVGHAVGERVRARHGERVRGDVGRDHVHPRLVRRDRDGDRPRPRTHVDDREGAAGDVPACGLDERLSLGARDEHARIHREAEAVELLPATEVRDRLAAGATVDELPVALARTARQLGVGMPVERLLLDARDVREQHVGIERGGLDPGGPKVRRRNGALRAPSANGRSIVAAMEPVVRLADIVAARAVVDRFLPRAPLERSPLLSADLGADVHLKIETFKPTRTFKVRGALNETATLDAAARRRGVVAASAGSHAQGVAFAAAALGAPATVIMPRGVSYTIVRVCQAYGAEVLLEGDVYDDTLALAHRIEREQGKTLIHPY